MNYCKNIVISFDLDNTLINNKEGIVNSFNYALKQFNIPKMRKNEIERMIGIPLDEMFQKVSSLNPKLLSTSFREYYGNKGIFQANLLPGIKDKLKELKKQSFIMGIITSKKQEMAIRITKYLEIFEFFDYIIGESEIIKSKLDPRLPELLYNKYPSNKIIIIGDHPKDRALAENLKAPFIGVLTGHHTAKELLSNIKVKYLILPSVKELTAENILSLLEN
ncbi:MAG: HAD family hydrolase [Candidatus Thorarchaeota archaeon]